MTEEIAWVDGDTEKLQITLRDPLIDSAHYFVFPLEFTIPRIIYSPDIEPVQRKELVIGEKEYRIMLSRIHYWGLVIWINPELFLHGIDSRPVCLFSSMVHTPRIWFSNTDGAYKKSSAIKGAPPLKCYDRLSWSIAHYLFCASIPSLKCGNPMPYPSIVNEEKNAIQNPHQRFDRASIVAYSAYVVMVGQGSDVSEVRQQLVEENEITVDSLTRFLERLSIP